MTPKSTSQPPETVSTAAEVPSPSLNAPVAAMSEAEPTVTQRLNTKPIKAQTIVPKPASLTTPISGAVPSKTPTAAPVAPKVLGIVSTGPAAGILPRPSTDSIGETPSKASTLVALGLPVAVALPTESAKSAATICKEAPSRVPDFGSSTAQVSTAIPRFPVQAPALPYLGSAAADTSIAATEISHAPASKSTPLKTRTQTSPNLSTVAQAAGSWPQAPRHFSKPGKSSLAAAPIQEVTLKIQNSDGTWDLKGVLGRQYLRSLNLAAFIAFVSQHSGVPLAAIESLTFKLKFGAFKRQIEFIHEKDGNEGWKELKMRMRTFFFFVREETPKETMFDVWIGIGDQRVIDPGATAADEDNELGW
jgi:hypothetical protein